MKDTDFVNKNTVVNKNLYDLIFFLYIWKPLPNLHDHNKEEKKNKHSVFLFLQRTESDDIFQRYYWEKKRLKIGFQNLQKRIIVHTDFEVPIGIHREMESREFNMYIWCQEGENDYWLHS